MLLGGCLSGKGLNEVIQIYWGSVIVRLVIVCSYNYDLQSMTEIADERGDLSQSSIDDHQQSIFGDEVTQQKVNSFKARQPFSSLGLVQVKKENQNPIKYPIMVGKCYPENVGIMQHRTYLCGHKKDKWTQISPNQQRILDQISEKYAASKRKHVNVKYRQNLASTAAKKQTINTNSQAISQFISQKAMKSQGTQYQQYKLSLGREQSQKIANNSLVQTVQRTVQTILASPVIQREISAEVTKAQFDIGQPSILNKFNEQLQPLQNNVERQTAKKLSQLPTDFNCEQNEIKLIELPKPPKLNKKQIPKKKNKKNQIIIFTTQEDQQQQPFINPTNNSLQFSKLNFNQQFNAGFIRGQSMIQQFNNLIDQGFITVEVKMRYRGPIEILKIKSFSLLLGKQKVEIRLAKQRGEYQCDKNYRDKIQIKQNVYEGRRQYSQQFKEANFKLLTMKLPARLESYFEVGREDVYQLKLQINILSITCFCKHKFQTSISSGVSCPKLACSMPSTIYFESFIIA